MRTHWITLIFLLSLVLGTCGVSQSGTEQAAELPPSEPQIVASENSPENPLQLGRTPESTEMPSIPPVEKFVALSKKDLADRLQVDADKVALVKTAEMLWPDAALGCPSPGKIYAPGRVPGYRIWLEVGGLEYIYHTDLTGQVILCPQHYPDDMDALPPTTPGPTQQIGVPID